MARVSTSSLVLLILACMLVAAGCGCPVVTPTQTPTPTLSPTITLSPIGTLTITEGNQKLPIFRESDVIGEMFNTSERFQSFYKEAMAEINRPIYWAYDPDQDIPAQNGYGYNGEPVVILRQIPVNQRDDELIAHEMEDLILTKGGFRRSSFIDPQFKRINRALNDMLVNPISYSKLKPYGFDLWESFQKWGNEAKITISNSPEPTDSKRLLWVFSYVEFILIWQDVLGQTQTRSEFELWFDQNYPHIAAESQELLILIREIDYDTPATHAELLQKIAEKYQDELSDKISF